MTSHWCASSWCDRTNRRFGHRFANAAVRSVNWRCDHRTGMCARRTSGLCSAHGRSHNEPVVCWPNTAVRSTNKWFTHRTRPFVRRTGSLCTAYVRSHDEPMVCTPHAPFVRRTGGLCTAHRLCGLVAAHRCSFDEQVVCAPHTAVRSTNMWFRHRTRPFVRRTSGVRTVRSTDMWFRHRTRPFVRRTSGLCTAHGRRTSGLCTAHGRSFHEQVVYAPHTVVPSSNKWFRHRTRPFVQRTSGFSFRRTNGRVRWLNHLFVERTAVFGHQFVVRTAVCGA